MLARLFAATAATAALMSLFVASARANPFAPEPPHSPGAEDAALAYWVGLALAILVIVAVNVFLIAALVKFKANRGNRDHVVEVAADRRAALVPTVIFSLFAIIAIVVGIATTSSARSIDSDGTNPLVASANTYAEVGAGSIPPYVDANGEPAGDLDAPGATNMGVDMLSVSPVRIQAIGQRWLWRYQYPGYNPQTAPRFSYTDLVVPVGTPVILDVTSVDVAHTWWVPSLSGQVQALPGSWTRTWFKVDKEGVYEGASTIFSGAAFPTMRTKVRAVDPVDYRDWVENLESDLKDAGEYVQSIVGNE